MSKVSPWWCVFNFFFDLTNCVQSVLKYTHHLEVVKMKLKFSFTCKSTLGSDGNPGDLWLLTIIINTENLFLKSTHVPQSSRNMKRPAQWCPTWKLGFFFKKFQNCKNYCRVDHKSRMKTCYFIMIGFSHDFVLKVANCGWWQMALM